MDRKDLGNRGTRRVGPIGQSLRQAVALAAAVALVMAPVAWADRTPLKPGWNMFSPQQDVEVGQQVSKDAERQVPMLNNSRVDNYLNNLGHRLSAHAPGYKFPYTYKTVNDRAINAFALPGGHVYINRGVIETADDEAQLAGVMAHETSHVALRHGTNQASKASAAQVPLAILGGLLGSNSTGAALAQLGAGFTLNSIMLKYSRTDESQADIMGTQILYDSGYDPRAMGQFLEKIQALDKGGHRVAFFSDHPSPDRRVERVGEEVARLGGAPGGAKTDSREFQDIKRYVLSLPAPPSKGQPAQRPQGDNSRDNGGSRSSPSNSSSDRFVSFENAVLHIDYPDNWQAYGQGDAVSIVPRGGLVDDRKGHQALAYGVIVNIYQPHWESSNPGRQQLQPRDYGQDSAMSLEQATDQLVDVLRQSNPNMRMVRYHEAIGVGGQSALSTYLSNDGPTGGRETDWLITIPGPEGGLLFIVFTAPENDFQGYENTFQQMLYSVRINR
jgi:hypothetical protein